MSIWNFKTIRSGSKGAEFVELSAAQQARIKQYSAALEQPLIQRGQSTILKIFR